MTERTEITDPKKVFLIKLVNMIDSVGWLLADGRDGEAMRLLSSLLARIKIANSNKELSELQRKMVEEYQSFVPRIRLDDSHKYYYLTSQYMNETYFKELNWVKPRIAGEGHLE